MRVFERDGGGLGVGLRSISGLCLCKFVRFIIRGELKEAWREQATISMSNMGRSKRHMLPYDTLWPFLVRVKLPIFQA